MATTSTGLGGDNELTGTDGADKIVAGGGDDTIDGSAGSDFLNAAGGNDTIIYDEYDYKILGGGGIDTLWFTGSGQSLNLGWNFVSGIEKLLLDGGGGHWVTFTAADIVRVSDTDQMIITGGKTNHIDPGTGWTFGGFTTDQQSSIFTNGLAKIIVSNLVSIDGYSNNASISSVGDRTLQEDGADGLTPLDGTLTASGTIYVSDQNAGQDFLFDIITTDGPQLGSFSLGQVSTSGVHSYSYTYTLDNAKVQELAEGDTAVDRFTVTAYDGKTYTLDFTSIGRNDLATISDVSNGEVIEDGAVNPDGMLMAFGTMTIRDPDQGESRFNSGVLTGSFGGKLAIDAEGTDNGDGSYTYWYTYTISNDSVQVLSPTEIREDKFTVYSADGHTSTTLTIEIHGLNNDITGTQGNDTLVGGAGPDEIRGLGGSDLVFGGAGDDRLFGGDGDDYLLGEDGNDYIDAGTGINALDGGLGNDTIYGSEGSDTVAGGGGNDLVYGNGAGDEIHGGDGDDQIHGGDGNDYLLGEGGNDYLNAGTGSDTVAGGDGDDLVYGNGAGDEVHGGDGDDQLYGGDGNDYLLGEGGNDYIDAGTGINALDGGLGNDTIIGAEGSDTVAGGGGNDIVYGNGAGDEIHGGDGDDQIFGGEGNDFLFGEAGRDSLDGGNGDDYLDGGDGVDFFTGSPGNDTMIGGAGADHFTLFLNLAGSTLITGGANTDVIHLNSLGTNNHITITDFDSSDFTFSSDYLDLRGLAVGSLSDLSLVKDATQDNLYDLKLNTGNTQITVLSLVGTGLTMDDLVGNITI